MDNGIAVGASGQVYLADSWNDRVVEFKVAGTPTPTVNPAVSLKASPKSLKVGHRATISGLVKNLVRGDKAVTICRMIGGKLIKLKLSPGLAAAWKQNKGRHMSETEAVRFVETKRREHALRQASPYLATRA